jgi:hypothetical protein
MMEDLRTLPPLHRAGIVMFLAIASYDLYGDATLTLVASTVANTTAGPSSQGAAASTTTVMRR